MRGAIVSTLFLTVIAFSFQSASGQVLSGELAQIVSREFGAKPEVVDQVVDTGLSHDDVVVTFWVAQRAKMSPVRVATIRSQGDTWRDIAHVRSLGPRDFYVMISGNIPSPRYSAIMDKFGFSAPPSNDWNEVPLTDEDINDLINAKFVASAYDYSIFEAMTLRDEGMEFAQICTEIGERKEALLEKQREERKLEYAGRN